MQCYQNGFDFDRRRWTYQPRSGASSEEAQQQSITNEVDVLIVGTGPAGLLIATQLSRFPGIKTAIIESRPGPLRTGQADGLQCRSIEIFEALGFSERVLREAYWVNEVTFWRPDTERGIVRGDRNIDTEEGLSEFPHVILNQARLHDFFLDEMFKSGLSPTYSYQLLDLRQDLGSDHVIAVLKSCKLEAEGLTQEVKARYVVGCDGARSSVRKSLGIELHGDSKHAAWGVADVLPDTNFPDIRFKCIIRSRSAGSLQIIPREGGYLVRIYVELDKLDIDERVIHRGITFDDLVAAARRIFDPYKFEVKECPWWSVYEIGQRLTDRFDNGSDQSLPNVFICGDACHTHSPKAGQGMNVSMQDGLNLGWKLAQVLEGTADPSLLATYNLERHACAKDLIDFDHELTQVFSAKNDIDAQVFEKFFRQSNRYMAGLAIQYPPSLITVADNSCHPELAAGYPVGKRFHSEEVLRCADARKLHLGHTMPTDGRWRVLVFGGDITSAVFPKSLAFCDWLGSSPSSPVTRFTPNMHDVDSVIEVKAIFNGSHTAVELDQMPQVLWPKKGRYRLRDCEKVFVDRWTTSRLPMQSVYHTRKISPYLGCVVVVRPDQHVSAVFALDDRDAITAFFAAFMRRIEK